MNMKHTQHGFTLLETLVAVSLLMLSIIGPLTIAQKSVKTSTYTKNRTTAYYLAVDAQEFLRNIRDTNSLMGGTWSTLGGVYGPCVNGRCDVDTQYRPSDVISNPATRALAIQNCGSANCPSLTFVDTSADPYNGYFGHKTANGTTIVESQYRREITIAPLNPDNRELLVRVDVFWYEGILGGEKKISLYDEVYDWQ